MSKLTISRRGLIKTGAFHSSVAGLAMPTIFTNKQSKCLYQRADRIYRNAWLQRASNRPLCR